MSAVSAAASLGERSLQSLLHRSIPSLRHSLTSNSRLAALDVTLTHVSVALSNRPFDTAFPFGVLARSAKPSADALILSSALSRAESIPPCQPLDIHALVVGIPPLQHDNLTYVQQLLNEHTLFPGLKALVFYSEAHALARAVEAQNDYVNAVNHLPVTLESRKLKRFDAAMNPKVGPDQVQYSFVSRATVSATELLQAVLDDLNQGHT